MEYVRGSEWRRWDLHIHTPNTAKNDKYKGKTIEEKWNIFYNDINAYMGDGSTPDKNISVLGITDYLSIDNYKKVIFDNRLPESIKLILPNVEMRMIPVTKCTGINIHFIFDPSIVNQLDDLFFSRLSFKYGTKQINYSATRSQLIQLGKDIDSTLDDDEAYKKGVGQYIPTLDSIRKVFEENTWLREKTIIIVSNSSNDGVSSAVNHSDYLNGKSGSDLDAVRLAIYQFADMVFSANPSDIAYFLGEGENKDAPEIVIQKCGKLMPCVHGSDAHENSNIFEPKNKRYCWIKADPTFNGLRQVIYEPKDRVKISAIKPEEKQPYYVIDRIEIEDSDFQQTPIFFNDKLNCIIGGKSTGKSILLHNLALTVDKKQVLKKIQLTKSNYRIISGVKVYWNDGEV